MSARVGYIIEQCWNRVPGGTAGAALEVGAALSARPDTEVIGVSARHRHPAPEPFRPTFPVAQVRLTRQLLFETWHLARRPSVETATGPVDVIHATGLAIPPRGAPLVVTLHDLAWVHEPGQFTAKGRRFFAQALDLIRRDADLILCSSQATVDDAAANGIGEGRLRLVPLGVHPATVDEASVGAVRQKFGLQRPYVLWVGTVEPRKNLSRLIEAFGRLRSDARSSDGDLDVDLVLVGPTGWHESLDAKLDRLGDRVHRLGFVDAHERDALYAGARLFVLPSLREGFGLPVLEAMAHGTAVVTSAGTSTEEIIGEAGVAIDPTDTAAIVTAMRELLVEPDRRQELAEAGRGRAGKFTWADTASATRRAYGELL